MGITVRVSTADVTNVQGAQQLVKEAAMLGSVGGIFNLAVVSCTLLLEEYFTLQNLIF
jgi:hypothetical protein